MKLNGWQRLWVVVSVPFVVSGLVSFIGSFFERPDDRGVYWEGVSIAVAAPLFMYAVGWAVAWVRRGFKGAP